MSMEDITMKNFRKITMHTHFINEKLQASLRKGDGYFVIIVSDRITDAVITEYHLGEITNDNGEDRFAIVNAKRNKTVAICKSLDEAINRLNEALFEKIYFGFYIEEFAMLF